MITFQTRKELAPTDVGVLPGMKSLLVDALRQAQDDTPNAESDDATTGLENKKVDASRTDEIAETNVAVDSAELDLLKTGAYTSGTITATDGTDETFIPEPLDDVATNRQLEDSRSHAELASTSLLTTRGAALADQKPMVTRIARFCPLICLIALTTAAAGYFVVSSLAAMSLNEDLHEMAGRAGVSASGTDSIDGNPALPKTGTSIFNDLDIVSTAMSETVDVIPSMLNPVTASSTPPLRRANDANAMVNVKSIAPTAQQINDPAHPHVVAAFAAYNAQDYATAEVEYAKALKAEPNHIDALVGVAAVYMQKERTDKALAAYEKLLTVDPGNTLAAASILSLRSSDPDWDSESELKHLLQRFPDAHHLHYALGSIYVAESRWPNAKQEFVAAHQLAPDNANYSYNAAVSMENIGEHRAARFYYEAALAAANSDSRIDKTAVSAHLKQLGAAQQELQ